MFLIRKGLKIKEFIQKIQETYKDDVYSMFIVYYQVNEIMIRKIELNNVSRRTKNIKQIN